LVIGFFNIEVEKLVVIYREFTFVRGVGGVEIAAGTRIDGNGIVWIVVCLLIVVN
jgi:hypothetical protein